MRCLQKEEMQEDRGGSEWGRGVRTGFVRMLRTGRRKEEEMCLEDGETGGSAI